LVIAGTGEEKYVHKIKELVKKLSMEEVIKFSGFVTEEQKNQLLSNAKLFVSASRSDVHPIAAIEALSFGLPVIITEESDFPEIDTFEAGKTTESNESSICDSIKDLLVNQDKLSTYSENALRLVEEIFLLENQIEKYENMFSKVITKK
jgi:glycosyltransferase involved in cell wall biosynthesis